MLIAVIFAFVVPSLSHASSHPQVLDQASTAPTGDFNLTITTNPSNATAPLDQPINITITVQSINGSPGNVVLSLLQALPDDGSGPTCDQLDSQKTVTPNPSATWSFTCWSGDQPLIFPLNFKAKSDTGYLHNVSVTLTYVEDTSSNNQTSTVTPRTQVSQSSIPPLYLLAGACVAAALIAGGLTAYFVRRHPFAPRIR